MAYSVKFKRSGHWYDCQTPGLSDDDKAQHDADLRVARKRLLYPSITTVLKDEFKNDFLDKWKTNELLLAAAGTYKQPHESNEQYCQRIYDLSLNKADTAADFGTKIHDAIEKHPAYPQDPYIHPWIDRFRTWYNANLASAIGREVVLFDHAIGIAGRCDWIGYGKGPLEDKIVLPDWKTQNVKTDDRGRKKPVFYESWPRQLSFYAVSHSKSSGTFPSGIPTCVSVIIDSNEPADPYVKVWEKEEILSAYEDVCIAAYRWFKKRKFWPSPYGPIKVGFTIEMPS